MAAKVNLILCGLLALAYAVVTLTEVEPAPTDREASALAALEDGVARDRADPALARALADRYLARGQASLTVAVLGAAAPSVREDPAILHRLARAYEQTGRVADAAATAQLAVALCGRSLGAADPSTPPPAHPCSEGSYASLEVHAQALAHLQRWGVTDARTDPRAGRAYALALRSARIATAGY